jgi:hypothetical protein
MTSSPSGPDRLAKTITSLAVQVPPAWRPLGRRIANAIVPQRRRDQQQWRRIDAAFMGVTPEVRQGPFRGMKLGENSTGSHYPKLLGTYEQELYPAITRLSTRESRTIVNIGCGEGYYAVGLGLMMNDATVYAFDTNENAQSACREAAIANGVNSRVTIRGQCSHAELDALCEGPRRTFVVIDCEGCEDMLIDPLAVPNLKYADLLIETHDFLIHGVSDVITSRFAATHDVEVIGVIPRSGDEVDMPLGLSAEDRARVLDESRPLDQTWLLLLALARNDVDATPRK